MSLSSFSRFYSDSLFTYSFFATFLLFIFFPPRFCPLLAVNLSTPPRSVRQASSATLLSFYSSLLYPLFCLHLSLAKIRTGCLGICSRYSKSSTLVRVCFFRDSSSSILLLLVCITAASFFFFVFLHFVNFRLEKTWMQLALNGNKAPSWYLFLPLLFFHFLFFRRLWD